MLRIATKTKLTPKQIISKAIDFFGPNGLKLTITSQEDTTASFEKDEGSVTIVATKEKNKTSVELTTRQWESQVEQFILMIH